MLVRHLGLVSETRQLEVRDLTRVAAALQKQVARDVSPIWTLTATVSAFASLDDVPLGYWPVVVVDDVKGAAGVHQDDDGQPYALVEAGEDWSLTASHETLEMLVDPFGNRLIAGPSVNPSQGRVEYLVEVCDPSEAGENGYTVNGLRVSDFYTPRFFDPVAEPGARYSFTGAITRPRQVLQGGYLSWRDPISGHWFQQIFFGQEPEYKDLGRLTAREGSFRSQVDRRTPQARRTWRRAPEAAALRALRAASQSAFDAASAKAASLRKQIAELTKS
jgi:hypothetical protein